MKRFVTMLMVSIGILGSTSTWLTGSRSRQSLIALTIILKQYCDSTLIQ